MSHEGRDLTFEIAGQVIVLEQDAVLERLMPALDLALGLRVISSTNCHERHSALATFEQKRGRADCAQNRVRQFFDQGLG
jgi:hypothetical protein